MAGCPDPINPRSSLPFIDLAVPVTSLSAAPQQQFHPLSTMSTAAKSPMKSALESALVAFIIWAGCLWLLVSGTQDGDIGAGRGVLCGLGMAVSLIAHWVYMGMAVRLAGRNVVGWMLLLVCTFPIASVVLGILLTSQTDDTERDSRAA
jgi:hypothetical protein